MAVKRSGLCASFTKTTGCTPICTMDFEGTAICGFSVPSVTHSARPDGLDCRGTDFKP